MTLADEKGLIRRYDDAVSAFKKAEDSLTVALDRLTDARSRGTPFEITPARKRAEEAEKRCNAAWHAVEEARRAYWMHKAAQAESELESLAMPPIAAIEFCSKAGGSLVSSPGVAKLTQLGCLPRPQYTHAAPVPALPNASTVMDRADDEI
jgi:hypothetical protein